MTDFLFVGGHLNSSLVLTQNRSEGWDRGESTMDWEEGGGEKSHGWC